MKRCWFGAGALAVLLVLGVLSSVWMGRHCGYASACADRAAEAADREDWDAAQTQINLTRQRWERHRGFTAVLSDHAPMEEVDALLALLGPGTDRETFRENALRLSQTLRALGASQRLSWSNLF